MIRLPTGLLGLFGVVPDYWRLFLHGKREREWEMERRVASVGGGAIAERRQQKDEEIEQKKNPTRTRIKRKKSTEKRVNRFDDVADRNSVTTR